MELYNLLYGLIGWIVVLIYALVLSRYKKKLHCPRCGKEWKKSNNIADDTFVCKCGMTTYDRHKFQPMFEDKSDKY